MKRCRSSDDVQNQFFIAGHDNDDDDDDNDDDDDFEDDDDAFYMDIDMNSDSMLDDDDALSNHDPIHNNSSHGAAAEPLAAHSSIISTLDASAASVSTVYSVNSSKSTSKTWSYRPVNWKEIARHYDLHGMLSTQKAFEKELSDVKTGEMLHISIKSQYASSIQLCFIYTASIIHLYTTFFALNTIFRFKSLTRSNIFFSCIKCYIFKSVQLYL